MFPQAYRKWIWDLYNKASWWLCFLVFEREKRADKPPVMAGEYMQPVEWKK
jgi:hypothetical protein